MELVVLDIFLKERVLLFPVLIFALRVCCPPRNSDTDALL
jgi:hypothetical protein